MSVRSLESTPLSIATVPLRSLGIALVLIAGYILLGAISAWAYVSLAGWDAFVFILGMVWGPIIVGVGGLISFLLGAPQVCEHYLAPPFWALTIANRPLIAFIGWLALPIIFNGASILLRDTGYIHLAEVVYTARFRVLPLVPAVLILVTLLYLGATGWFTKESACEE